MSQINVDDIFPFSVGVQSVNANGVYIDGEDSTSSMKMTSTGNPVIGINNTYIGWQAGVSLTLAGASNTFFGKQAGASVTGGGNNVLLGSSAGPSITTGFSNVMIGAGAGGATTGNGNVFIGHITGQTTTTGTNNIILGYQSFASTAITLGNSNHNVLRCAVTSITSLSDARDKKDVAPIELGIDFVKELNPVKFVWDDRNEDGKHDIADSGFIAQELKAVEDKYDAADVLKLVYDENPEKLEASYGRLIPVLVQAIKDLAAKVEELENK
jgi:trimeric autotransporter adhesin